jgi:hypothetical protein
LTELRRKRGGERNGHLRKYGERFLVVHCEVCSKKKKGLAVSSVVV